MTTHPEQVTNRDRLDPMVEALMKKLLGSAAYEKAASGTEDAVTAALMASLISPARTEAQASSFDKIILADALAPTLADALARALADALVPALVKALNMIVSSKDTGQDEEKKRKSYG